MQTKKHELRNDPKAVVRLTLSYLLVGMNRGTTCMEEN